MSADRCSYRGRALIKKWTNEREKWMKWRRRYEISGSNSCKKPPYSDQLSFLEKIFEPSTSNNDAADTEADQDEEKPAKSSAEYEMPEFVSTSCQPDNSHSQRTRSAKKRRSLDEYEIELNSVKPTSSPASFGETPMLSFFRGILPSLEEFDADEHLDFQIQTLSLIRSMKKEKRRKIENF
nr:uncharacterized protein LOC128675001 isoform X2 [Plodia interpunctella]